MSPIAHAALFFPLFFALTALCACFQRRRARRHGVWNYLTPGPFYWFGLFSGVIVAAVGTLVAVSGRGSPWFAVFFALVTMSIALQGIFEEVRWDENRLQRRTLLQRRREMSWHELARMGVEWSGYHWVASHDGPAIRFSSHDNGFDQLMVKAHHHLPSGGPPAEPVNFALPVRAVMVPLPVESGRAGARQVGT